jgi:LuxR family maltose regulon positive regulatory protein
MSGFVLATKLYIPQPRPDAIPRPRLVARLDQSLQRKLTLISAAAGFGKTTLISEWAAIASNPTPYAALRNPIAWLSLDEGDSDPARFLVHLVAALQTLRPPAAGEAPIGQAIAGALHAPQLPPLEAILTPLLNDLAALPDHFMLVLDDYHLVDAAPVDRALAFLLEHGPPRMHVIIATREDPNLPLARLRARGQLTEIRAADLRFTPAEVAVFFNQAMGLQLTPAEITALETRTEGWAAGLQLAALSVQGQADRSTFIHTFSGSHRYVLDYLVEEVLEQQPAHIQRFLLHTSILDRLCGPLCDAVLRDPATPGQETLEDLERANLFIIPLDNERDWYRYHHLFGELLRQRLAQQEGAAELVAELHTRGSIWYEAQGLDVEAFQHATAANDVARAARLVEGDGMPLLFRGAVMPVLDWLASLPTAVMDERPGLWVLYASAQLFVGRLPAVKETLLAAEAALRDAEPTPATDDLTGHIAAIRAAMAVARADGPTILAQSLRALDHLHADNLPVRTATIWTLGVAHDLQGNRVAASRAYAEAIAGSQAIGHFIITIAALIGLGGVQERENQLPLAVETYRGVLGLVGDAPLPVAAEAHLGLARICYEWNDLEAAEEYGQKSLQLARQLEETDRAIACELFLVRLALAQGNEAEADARLARAGQAVREETYAGQRPNVAAAQVQMLLRQAARRPGAMDEAARLAAAHDLPVRQARVSLAQGDAPAALALLERLHEEMTTRGWADEALKLTVLRALATQAQGAHEEAMNLLADALAQGAPGGFIRLFIDEGTPMAELLARAAAQGIMPDYARQLLAALPSQETRPAAEASGQALIEPLSERELEVLALVAAGLSNAQISERLFLALSTVKGHNRNIFGKLGVRRRTEAVARARELGLV